VAAAQTGGLAHGRELPSYEQNDVIRSCLNDSGGRGQDAADEFAPDDHRAVQKAAAATRHAAKSIQGRFSSAAL